MAFGNPDPQRSALRFIVLELFRVRVSILKASSSSEDQTLEFGHKVWDLETQPLQAKLKVQPRKLDPHSLATKFEL